MDKAQVFARFIKEFILEVTYSYFDFDGELKQETAYHHTKFGTLHPIVSHSHRTEDTIDIEFPEDGAIHGTAIGVQKDYVEFVGSKGSTSAPAGCGGCK